jgi:hypothetical protein
VHAKCWYPLHLHRNVGQRDVRGEVEDEVRDWSGKVRDGTKLYSTTPHCTRCGVAPASQIMTAQSRSPHATRTRVSQVPPIFHCSYSHLTHRRVPPSLVGVAGCRPAPARSSHGGLLLHLPPLLLPLHLLLHHPRMLLLLLPQWLLSSQDGLAIFLYFP